jgi:molybdenum cofactor biosynthesis protein B
MWFMSVETRNAPAEQPLLCAVLTISDSRSLATDTSGHAVVDLFTAAGHRVIERDLVRDEPLDVRSVVERWSLAGQARVIVTTGGTGIAKRDSSYEAIRRLLDKELPGFGELFRSLSFAEIGPPAMLSRAIAGIIGRTAVFVLPGSEHAVRLAMNRLIVPEVVHIVRELDR